jgi:hypothetical protein
MELVLELWGYVTTLNVWSVNMPTYTSTLNMETTGSFETFVTIGNNTVS